MNYPSFVSPFSRPGFGILNDNASFTQEGMLQYEAEQSIYLNGHQYHQPHAHNPEGFFDASITDSSPYGPTDQSVYVKDVTHPGSDTRNESLFRLPASPEMTQTIMQDGDRRSQLQEADIQFDPKYKVRGDRNPPFVKSDFANICTYLEKPENYDDLFGNSKKQSWGKKKHTHAQAFKQFAMYLNINHERGTLELNGHNIQQRWRTYKCKFMDTAQWLNHTGSGISNGLCGSLKGEIDSRCPFFDQMVVIFGNKQNMAGHNVYDTSMVMDGKDEDDIDEEGNLDVHNNVSHCGSDRNDNGSVTAKDKEPTGTRSKTQKRRHHSDESEENSEQDNRNEASHIQPHLLASKKNVKGNSEKSLQPNEGIISDQLVTKPKSSVFGFMDRKMEIQDRQLVDQMYHNLQYKYDHDEVLSKMKDKELKEINTIKLLELNYNHEIEQEKLKRDLIALDLQKEVQLVEMELKRDLGKRTKHELEEATMHTKKELDLKQMELEQKDRRLAHDIALEKKAQRFSVIDSLRRDVLSVQEIKEHLDLLDEVEL
ncbi:hypothetical protein O181_046420 [Austropuccinia psidii MF-1]|uniref:No apical meristem-associated C-terminal domain-containing protein n=1 Tax=Austropuccinia psidii MF-1 TaxID=1389203 RepID=A0A9Q3DTB5_9BASI|nr:hypothetical protein [Austropuccinia psidii MF-1]